VAEESQLPDAAREAKLKVTAARRKALAFQEVFGQPGRRSAASKIVIQHLRDCCGFGKPVFQPDKQGAFDPLRAAHIDGAQTQCLIIDRQLEIARGLENEDKPKPKVKRE
jgi:hypothetical protein